MQLVLFKQYFPLFPRRSFFPANDANYTVVHQLYQDLGSFFPLDRVEMKIPFEQDITIYNRTKVCISVDKL